MREQKWELLDHCCQYCLGRLVQSTDETTGQKTVMCVECEASAIGEHDALCCCGVEAGALGRVLECIRNPVKSPQAPQVVLVREKIEGFEIQQKEDRPSRAVRCPEPWRN